MSAPCCYCGETGHEMRPYGPNGALTCFDCGTSPEHRDLTLSMCVMASRLAEQESEDGIAMIAGDGIVPHQPKSEN